MKFGEVISAHFFHFYPFPVFQEPFHSSGDESRFDVSGDIWVDT